MASQSYSYPSSWNLWMLPHPPWNQKDIAVSVIMGSELEWVQLMFSGTRQGPVDSSPSMTDDWQGQSCVGPVQRTSYCGLRIARVVSSLKDGNSLSFILSLNFYILPSPLPQCSPSLEGIGVNVLFRTDAFSSQQHAHSALRHCES